MIENGIKHTDCEHSLGDFGHLTCQMRCAFFDFAGVFISHSPNNWRFIILAREKDQSSYNIMINVIVQILIPLIFQMRKIIVSADCNGNMDFLIKKVSSLHSTNHFDFMLLLGNVMDLQSSNIFSQLRQCKLTLPLPTYFIECSDLCKPLNTLYPNGKELFPNFTYLGRAGVQTIKGVKIAYLSGVSNDKVGFNVTEYTGKYYTKEDVDGLCERREEKIDILVTNQWPEDRKAKPQKEVKNASAFVAEVVNALCPRYHFAGMEGMYFKRPEYKNRKGMSTSFISIGPINKEFGNKQKYLHGIQIVPFAEMTQQLEISSNLEENPFAGVYDEKLKILNTISHVTKPTVKISDLKQSPIIYFERFSDSTHESEIQEFLERWGKVKRMEIFFDNHKRRHKGTGVVVFEDVEIAKKCLSQSGYYSLYGSKIRFTVKTDQNQYTDQNCWFCKESQVFDESLVVSYGRHCYLALDKGPIVDSHYLIVPYKHVTNSVTLDSPAKQQIFRISNRLRLYFIKNQQATITFQRFLNLSHSVNHYIIQCIPVPLEKIDYYSQTFEKKCLTERLNFIKVSEVDFENHVKNKFYFRIQFDQKIYVMVIKEKNFPIDFGRQTICELLDLTERINWKSCVSQIKSQVQRALFTKIVKEAHIM